MKKPAPFLKNSWYVFAWAHELDAAHGILGRVLIDEPVVVWRDANGQPNAFQDRCPHRRTPLSLGRVRDGALQCMYHGMAFDAQGACVGVPGLPQPPIGASVRTFPVIERYDWIWVWMGDPARADASKIPEAFGINTPGRQMRSGHIDYDAHYQLIHDNLCDLSHVDFVHETTLRPLTGAFWSQSQPKISSTENGVRFERWFESAQAPGDTSLRVDTWSTYDFYLPGIFVMRAARYPEGTAKLCAYTAPVGVESINETIEQQAVSPISQRQTAYYFATGLVGVKNVLATDLEKRIAVMTATFDEDRRIIEAQQRSWDLAPNEDAMVFLPQDKGPHLMRKLLEKRIREEVADGIA